MSASRICPGWVETALEPSCSPMRSAVTRRVKARTPGVKAMSGWWKQRELRPSAPQGDAVDVRESGDSEAGVRVVPLTPVHGASEVKMACSISVSLADAVLFCVRMVIGLAPRVVLQRRTMLPAPVGWRTSGTVILSAYANA